MSERKTWMDGFFESDDPDIDWNLVRAGGAGDGRLRPIARRLTRQPDPDMPAGDWNGLITEEEVKRASK